MLANTTNAADEPILVAQVGEREVEVFERVGRSEGRYCLIVYGELGSALHWVDSIAEAEAFIAGLAASEAT